MQIIKTYGLQLTNQTSALESKRYEEDERLWEEKEKIASLVISFEKLRSHEANLEIRIKIILKAKKILDVHLLEFKSRVEKMSHSYTQGDWGRSFTNNGLALKPVEVKEKIRLRHANFDLWRGGFKTFLEYLKRDVNEFLTIYYSINKEIRDDFSTRNAMEEYYKEELEYIHSSAGKFKNLLEGSERLSISVSWSFDPDRQ